MKRVFLLAVFVLSVSLAQARISVSTPESVTLDTRSGLVLIFSNQLEGLANNDAVAYIVVSGQNKSQKPVRLAPSDFVLKNEAGSIVAAMSARDALKTVVEWNYENAKDYVRVSGTDLRDVLRIENRRYTSDRAFNEVSLNPREEIKERLLFFPKLAEGKYSLTVDADRVEIIVGDGVYFVRAGEPNKAGAVRKVAGSETSE